MAMSKGFRVLEKNQISSSYSILLENRLNKTESLLFESNAIAVLTAHETDLIRKQYNKILDAYGCLGVLQMNSGDSCILYLILLTGITSVGRINDSEIFRITQTQFISLQQQSMSNNSTSNSSHSPISSASQHQMDDKISEIRKILNSGTFYFSTSNSNYDLTLCAQRRCFTNKTDVRFFWNRMLHIHFLRFGVTVDQWLLKIICGFIEIRTIYAGSHQAKAVIISRLSNERAGTRFNVRGCNDDGHVANFVETEQVIYVEKQIISHIQTRGSVPLFWEQPGVQVGSHKVRMSRGFLASRPAFQKHMTLMKDRYGQFAIINLLGTSMIGSKEGEAMLSNDFQKHHQSVQPYASVVPHIVFDYHQESKNGQQQAGMKLKEKLTVVISPPYGYFHSKNGKVIREQIGVLRTNCLDCLDRTNCVQTYIGVDLLNEQIDLLNLGDQQKIKSRFNEVFQQMWINNGNEISKIYAGTGAIQGGSKLMDGARSAARTIQNNLLDNSKQEAIDILLIGSSLNSELADRVRVLLPSNMLHAPTSVLREMCNLQSEYSEDFPVRIACATYNVNGGKHFRSVVYKDVSLSDWLINFIEENDKSSPVESGSGEPPIDVYAIAFQEIVDLNAGNIVAASSDNAKQWAEELQRTLDPNIYTLLTYQQLVGVCLYIFIRNCHTEFIRDLATDSVKTGMGGATGNKGATAIRFVLHGTSLCFVGAHFAAGQNQIHERNEDYNEITRKLQFPMGCTLKSHDWVFWAGDFNYRVDYESKEEIRSICKRGEWNKIIKDDQLTKERESGNVFTNYQEGILSFPPTYKYDLFSDDYDTSEKMRTPAWTDRILWSHRPFLQQDNEDGKLIYYGCANLKQSDHRPVIAVIDIECSRINTANVNSVFEEVLKKTGPTDSTIIIKEIYDEDVSNDSSSDEEKESAIYDENIMKMIVDYFMNHGEVTLVRYVDPDQMLITFQESSNALQASQNPIISLDNYKFSCRLKTDNWLEKHLEERSLCTSNTICLTKNCKNRTVTPPQRPNKPVIR